MAGCSDIRREIVKIISTFFYIGYLPFIPGTFGSLMGLALFYLIRGNLALYIVFSLLLLVLGFLTAGPAEKIFHKKDAPFIVIDEVCGMFLGLAFLPYEPRLFFLSFICFRILDSLKPYPAGSFQNLKSSLGVMSDDIIAGLYTNIIFQVVWRLASFRA